MPVIGIEPRLREIGRIRAGDKGAKGQPQKLENWRLTSPNKSVLEEAAGLWGGTVREWADEKNGQGQWELYTDTHILPIQVPHMREPISQWYESWSGGGCLHRCDGEMDELTGDPCSCNPEHRQQAGKGDHPCKLTTRAKFFLPDLPGVGVWRLESHGYYAAVELTGSIALINLAAAEGIGISGSLRLEQRTSVTEGRTNRYVVPVIDIDVNLRELSSGIAGPGLPSGARPEILTPQAAPELPAPAPGSPLAGEFGNAGEQPSVGSDSTSQIEQPPAAPEHIPTAEWDEFQSAVESDGVDVEVLRQITKDVVGRATKNVTRDQLNKISLAVIEYQKGDIGE